MNPYIKKDEQIPFPCGKCPECLKRRASGWSFRLIKEELRSTSALFVTLTYSPDYVLRFIKDETYTIMSKNHFLTLNKKHVQLFFKRLRKLQKDRIKYYAVGEYGSDNSRPHYHLILFNSTMDNVLKAWALDDPITREPVPFGSVYFGDVRGASVGYVLKYMTKLNKIPEHKNDDRQKEFSLMSKGLGSNYLTEKMVKWHHDDLTNRSYVTTDDNKKISMPRYYKNKIYDEYQQQMLHIAHKEKSYEQQEKTIAELGENWQEILNERRNHAFKKMYSQAHKGRKNNL